MCQKNRKRKYEKSTKKPKNPPLLPAPYYLSSLKIYCQFKTVHLLKNYVSDNLGPILQPKIQQHRMIPQWLTIFKLYIKN